MFRFASRLPLRRCLHTSSLRSTYTTRPTRTVGFVLGASAALTGYLAWNSQRSIALDSAGPVSKPSEKLSPKSSASPESLVSSHPAAVEHEPSLPPEDTVPPSQNESLSPGPSKPESPFPGEGADADADADDGAGAAFNPVTGEINWDCPCLGGMAHGICGAQFREAFSCFVFSEQEPKGIDCVEKFKLMQDCFREHPDVYGDDIMDDDDDDDGAAAVVDGDSLPTDTTGGHEEETFSPAPSPTPSPSTMYTNADQKDSTSNN